MQVPRRILTQLPVEGLPESFQTGEQPVKFRVQRLTEPGDVQLPDRLRLLIQLHQSVGERTMLKAVVQVQLTGPEALADLSMAPSSWRRVGLPERRGSGMRLA